MIRDINRSEEYFKKRYERDVERLECAIKDYKEALEEQGEGAPGLRIGNLNIINKIILKIYSGYSLGIDARVFTEDVNFMLDNIIKSWIGTSYYDIEKGLELAIICDINTEKVIDLIKLLKKYKYKDQFLDMLAQYFDSTWEIRTNKLKFKKATTPLIETIETSVSDKQAAAIMLKTYLEKQWLNMQSGGLITKRDHLTEDRYRGYWCIEAVALVKMLDLDDEVLKECKYYPYDLAHCKE